MRTAILSGLIFALLTACQSADVDPEQFLYRTWERQPATSLPGTDQLLTFQADGQVRYGVNQAEAGCCRPDRVKLTNGQLVFFTGSLQPICAQVSCVASPLFTGNPWTITTLTSTELVISHNSQRIFFKAR